MATGPRKGLNPNRKVGSGPNNSAVSHYTIANSYSTSLGIGDPVQLSSGNIVIGAAAGATVGVFQGVNYIASDGRPAISKYWPASTSVLSGTTIDAFVTDDPMITYLGVANGTVAQVKVGNIYAMDVTPAVDTRTGRSQATIQVIAQTTGTLSVVGATNMASLTNLENGDVFTVKSSVGNTTATVTIATNQTIAAFLALINGVATGVTASVTAGGFLNIAATDGGSLVLTDSTGTPLADSNTLTGQTTTATITPTVAYNTSTSATLSILGPQVKVINVIDTVNNVLEVVLVNDPLRGTGASA